MEAAEGRPARVTIAGPLYMPVVVSGRVVAVIDEGAAMTLLTGSHERQRIPLADVDRISFQGSRVHSAGMGAILGFVSGAVVGALFGCVAYSCGDREQVVDFGLVGLAGGALGGLISPKVTVFRFGPQGSSR